MQSVICLARQLSVYYGGGGGGGVAVYMCK